MSNQITLAEPEERFAIPLDEAFYCESCRVILNHSVCFCCGSGEHSSPLAPWLDRESEVVRLPSHGVFLSVTPHAKKLPHEADSTLTPQRLPQAS